MASAREPVLRQRIFEARYEQGYRYLDRCGEALLILESLLETDTGHTWFPTEMSPSGARLQCPDLDIAIVFDARHLVVDQNPVGDVACDFIEIATSILSTITGRFDLRKMQRFGFRRMKLLAADSIEDSESLSVRFFAGRGLKLRLPDGFEPRAFELVSVFESPDRSKGMRLQLQPYAKLGTDLKVDERLRQPPHFLPQRQHEALKEQLKRRKLRQFDPVAGLNIDIDYYWVWPPKESTALEFLREAAQQSDMLETMLLSGDRT